MIKFTERAPYAPVEYLYDVEEILYKGKSKFQEIVVIKNPYFGKMLILDDVVQLTERDEFFYHEMLTHIALFSHPSPKRIAVIGGGDGGVVREVTKHKIVEKIYFVEIDEEVINISKRFFPTVSYGIDDTRVDIKIMDGAEFIKKRKTQDLDVVIIDSTDIVGFARTLFTDEFFESVHNCLTDNGIFVTHTESMHFHKDMVIEIHEVLRKTFPVVDLYTTCIATYPGNWWAFAIATKGLSPREVRREVDIETKFYDQDIHINAFLPKSFYSKLLERRFIW